MSTYVQDICGVGSACNHLFLGANATCALGIATYPANFCSYPPKTFDTTGGMAYTLNNLAACQETCGPDMFVPGDEITDETADAFGKTSLKLADGVYDVTFKNPQGYVFTFTYSVTGDSFDAISAGGTTYTNTYDSATGYYVYAPGYQHGFFTDTCTDPKRFVTDCGVHWYGQKDYMEILDIKRYAQTFPPPPTPPAPPPSPPPVPAHVSNDAELQTLYRDSSCCDNSCGFISHGTLPRDILWPVRCDYVKEHFCNQEYDAFNTYALPADLTDRDEKPFAPESDTCVDTFAKIQSSTADITTGVYVRNYRSEGSFLRAMVVEHLGVFYNIKAGSIRSSEPTLDMFLKKHDVSELLHNLPPNTEVTRNLETTKRMYKHPTLPFLVLDQTQLRGGGRWTIGANYGCPDGMEIPWYGFYNQSGSIHTSGFYNYDCKTEEARPQLSAAFAASGWQELIKDRFYSCHDYSYDWNVLTATGSSRRMADALPASNDDYNVPPPSPPLPPNPPPAPGVPPASEFDEWPIHNGKVKDWVDYVYFNSTCTGGDPNAFTRCKGDVFMPTYLHITDDTGMSILSVSVMPNGGLLDFKWDDDRGMYLSNRIGGYTLELRDDGTGTWTARDSTLIGREGEGDVMRVGTWVASPMTAPDGGRRLQSAPVTTDEDGLEGLFTLPK